MTPDPSSSLVERVAAAMAEEVYGLALSDLDDGSNELIDLARVAIRVVVEACAHHLNGMACEAKEAEQDHDADVLDHGALCLRALAPEQSP